MKIFVNAMKIRVTISNPFTHINLFEIGFFFENSDTIVLCGFRRGAHRPI